MRGSLCFGLRLLGTVERMTGETTDARVPGGDLSTEELKAEIASVIRLATRDRDAAAAHNRRAAELIVTLRGRFQTPTGEPDLLGEFRPYREAVREVYADAGVSPSDRSRVQSAIRYHVGNVLRERYQAEELERLGIMAESPYEKTKERRMAAAEELQESRLASATNEELLATIRGLTETVEQLREELGDLRSRASKREAG